jgi:hypothetical protein
MSQAVSMQGSLGKTRWHPFLTPSHLRSRPRSTMCFSGKYYANVGSRTDSALFSCILFSQADAGQTVPKDPPNVYLMVFAGKGARHMVV